MCVLWLLLLVVKIDWLLLYVEVGGREQQQHTKKKKQSNKTKKIIVHRNNKRNILENFYGNFFSFFALHTFFSFFFR